MKRLPLCFAMLTALVATTATATQLNYHGDLMDGDQPASGSYDLRLRTYADAHGKSALGGFVELPNVEVVDGGFAVELDLAEAKFGDTFVEVAVRKAESGAAFEVIGAPQKLAKANNGCWALDGNTGLPAGSFLGNADPVSTAPLVLRARNTAVATLTPRGSVGAFGDAPSVAFGSSVNVASQAGASVAGGGATLDGIGSPCATCKNQATASFATVGGGIANRASGASSTIAGGSGNTAVDGDGAIGGGSNNTTSHSWATVAGGTSNAAIELASTVGGGENNAAAGLRSTVAGGHGNQATHTASTIGGGNNNSATGVDSTVAGGSDNDATGEAATVAGGSANLASSESTTIGGGNGNSATAHDATVAGGLDNHATGDTSAVGGGFANLASGSVSTVGGGNMNAAVGSVATVPGGFDNCAGGSYSFAAGASAKIRPPVDPGTGACGGIGVGVSGVEGDKGTFVFADSQGPDFISSGRNQFLVRAGGGVGFNVNQMNSDQDFVFRASDSAPDSDGVLQLRSRNGNTTFLNTYQADGESNIGSSAGHLRLITTAINKYIYTNDRLGVKRLPAANMLEVEGEASKATPGDWLANSDGRIKRDIEPIDDALTTIQKLRPVTYLYTPEYIALHKAIDDTRYYNVIAQEFAEVFPGAVKGSGEYLPGEAKSRENEILQVDTWPAQITAIAAIQELALHDDEQRDAIAELKSENAELRALVAAMSARLARLETGKEQ